MVVAQSMGATGRNTALRVKHENTYDEKVLPDACTRDIEER